MTPRLQRLHDALRSVLGDSIESLKAQAHGDLTVVVKAARYHEAALALRDHPDLRFEQATDLCGVDYSTYADRPWERERFAAVLHLLSLTHNVRLRVRVFAPDDGMQIGRAHV